jgi:hypothetical protein
MHSEDQNQKDPPHENDKGKQSHSEAKDDDKTSRGRGLSDELVEGETLDVTIDPAKRR